MMKTLGFVVSWIALAPVVQAGHGSLAQKGPSSTPPVLVVPGIPVPPAMIALVGGSDNCATPDVIVGNGPFAYDSSIATTGLEGQTNARCFIFNTSGIAFDVWFQWTAGATGWVQLNTCVGGAHDLKVAVYAGAGCPTIEPIACDDDRCGTVGSTSSAPFFATAGSVYTFQIGSYPGQAGAPGSFTMDPFTPVANDDCATATVLTGNGPFGWDTTNATTGFVGQAEVLCSSEMLTYDVWYKWVSNCTGSAVVSLCAGSFADTKLAVYQANGCPTSSSLACNDDFCAGGGPSEVTFSAVLGQTYMIQLGMWPGEVPSTGSFTLTTPCPPDPGVPFCSGDASGTACPCANNSAVGDQVGCLSSLSTGAKLRAVGTAAITNDTVVLTGSQMSNSSVLYFQGTTQQNAGLGAVFGDGLRCAGGSVVRLATKTNVGGTSSYPVGAEIKISVKGLIPAGGATRTYQAWYRNSAAFCTVSTFNLSNGHQIVWGP